jgi:hypothetical protein
MPYSNFFSSFDYENTDPNQGKKPKEELERHEYVQRAGDWNRWSRASVGTVCPVYIKIDERQHQDDWKEFVNETDKAKVLRNDEGELFVRMDALLDKKPLYENFDKSIKAIKVGEQPPAPEDFLKPIKNFFKEYVLWQLSQPDQDKMSEDMIKHFHQGGVCTVANRGLTQYMGGKSINFSEAKQKMLFEATDDGFKFSERNKYYKIMDTNGVKESGRSFLSTRVDLSVKTSELGSGIKIDKVVISAKPEVMEQFPEMENIEVGLFQKIWDMIKSFFGAKNTTEIDIADKFIPFSVMEENENLPIAGPHPGA